MEVVEGDPPPALAREELVERSNPAPRSTSELRRFRRPLVGTQACWFRVSLQNLIKLAMAAAACTLALFCAFASSAEALRTRLMSGAFVESSTASDAWVAWPDSGPVKNIPFPKSEDLLGFEYLPNANAQYGGADTWYPSWAADGNLYTPWTDGTVNGVRSGSGGKPASGWNSTTGYATVTGDDPFKLNVTKVGLFTSSTYPYEGRYPCGSVVVGEKWYYGTYYLDNPNASSPAGKVGPNPGPNCGNWCVQGPFSGFRVSQDGGMSWNEPRVNATSPSSNLFSESAFNNGKVKYGAPHVVDFGRNNSLSPDGKIYVVGHGASRPEAIQAWMLGDEVYLARVEPTEDAIMDGKQWEFWAGEARGWVRGDVNQAAPLISWENTTGVVTMTYIAPLRKYVLVVSTANEYPSMVKAFDTYFLESDSITGPWKYVTYMSAFGPEAYFANFPSKFLATGATSDGYYEAFLSYSANFAMRSVPPNPPGSGYHWSLQQTRFRLGKRIAQAASEGQQ